jgi:DNA-binding beta-propeller fold protein YncE
MPSTPPAERPDPGRTYFLRWPYLLYIALPVALALAPGLILLPAFQIGDYASDRLGVYTFLLVASFALFDLAAWIAFAMLSVRLFVSSRGIIFYGIGYAIQSTWPNVAQVQTEADGTPSSLVLRQSGADNLGVLGALSVILPLLSFLDPRRIQPVPVRRVDPGRIGLKPFVNDQLQADISQYAPPGALSSDPATDSAGSPASAVSAASEAAGPGAPPAPARSHPGWRLAVLVVGLAAVLLAEVGLGRSMLERWQGVPPLHSFTSSSWVNGVAFYPDSQSLRVAADAFTLQLLSASDGTLIQTLVVTTPVASFALSPDGLTMAIGSDNGTLSLWAANAGVLLHTLPGHRDRVNSLAFSPDGQTLASGSNDGTVRLWRVADGALRQTLRAEASDTALEAVNGAAFSPDGQRLVVAADSLKQTVQLWAVPSGTLLGAYAGNTFAKSAVFAPDGQTLVAATIDQGLWVMSASRLSVLRTLAVPGASKPFFEWMAVVAPDGQLVASVTNGGTLQLWRLSDGALLDTLRAHTASVRVVAFSPDGRYVATGSHDGTVRVWAVPAP